MHAHQTHVWYNVVSDVIRNYNNSWHSGIRTRPIDVNSTNESALWKQQYLPPEDGKDVKKKVKPFKFKPGDVVRLSFNKRLFTRHYDQSWTDQLYIVASRFRRDGINVYKIHDYTNTSLIDGSLYSPEMAAVSVNPDTMYRISRVLKTKTLKGKKYSLVRWTGWDPSYDSYIPNTELKRFK